MNSDIVAELTKMIAEGLDLRMEDTVIDPTAPLLEGGLMLDSMVLFEFIALIEKHYDVSFPADELNSQTFASLNVLAQNIADMQAAKEN
jgi:acyl carrier protein